MNELLEKLKLNKDESFYIGVFQDHISQSRWHYHPEYELSFITEGAGKRIVGDSTEEFNPGDLIFIGPHIPHVWISESPYKSLHSGRTLESVYLLFNHDILPPELLSIPEFENVRKALSHSERGIKIQGQCLNKVSELMLQMPYLKKMKRITYFYEIMDIIGQSESFTFLASKSYEKNPLSQNDPKFIKIHQFLMENYHKQISLEQLAELVHMAPGSLCRFFKSRTGMTIFHYLNKLKIGLACKMLLNTSLNIVEISYDCGFSNLSYFNRQFLRFTGKTPSEFREILK